MIELKHVTKNYLAGDRTVAALRDISLCIDDGEIYGIIGMSGAGKSTLVRCMNLLERPDEGQIIIDGKSLTELSRKDLLKLRQRVGMIFQGFNLLEQRTVLRNVTFPLEVAGVGRKEARERALELLRLVGLSERAEFYPAQLSGGQKQRVAIARALTTRPKYLLCDEATSALDPNTTRSIMNLLQEINRTLGVTIVVITHEMKVIDSICGRVAVIDRGHIAEEGPVRHVFAAPQSDAAREMLLPEHWGEAREPGRRLRLTGAGNPLPSTLIADLTLVCQRPIGLLEAEPGCADGHGRITVELPADEAAAEKAEAWLAHHGILREEV